MNLVSRSLIMDSQVRNFRDFLQLYNKLTEMCFKHCVSNLFTRDLSPDESTCLDKCVRKFTNVNQRVMSTYITEQSHINERRMKEVEAQLQTQNAIAAEPNVSVAEPMASPVEPIASLAEPSASAATPISAASIS